MNRMFRFFILSVFLTGSVIADGQVDSLKRAVIIHGSVQVTNNGISFVPAFSLGRAASITMLYITSNRFYYYPEFDLGLDFKPWQIGQRLGYNIIKRKKFNLALGTGLGLYFNQYASQITNEEFQLQRYTMGELGAGYSFSGRLRLQAFYFYSRALDKVGIESGHMIMVNLLIDRIKLSAGSYLSFAPTFVWLTNTAPYDGVFVSQVTSFHLDRIKPNLFVQTTVPVYTKPHSDFIWNTGISFPF
jgi:hypothetical protein